MILKFWTNVAERFHAVRWWFGMSPFVAAGSAMFALSLAPNEPFPVSLPLVATGSVALILLITIPWGISCACVWFHPTRGILQSGSRVFGRLPMSLQKISQHGAALFLTFFVFVAAVVFPATVLFWL